MFEAIARFFGFDRPQGRRLPPDPKLIFTKDCFEAVRTGLAPKISQRHEGIIYLLGRTDGLVTLATAVFRPEARTTQGSFDVPATAMIPCVELASNLELQIVGQIHTHPKDAFHSDGDVEGARIRHPGYVSLVIPNYGTRLPDLAGTAAYIWQSGKWNGLRARDIVIIPGAGPWIAKNGLTSGTAGLSGTQVVA